MYRSFQVEIIQVENPVFFSKPKITKNSGASAWEGSPSSKDSAKSRQIRSIPQGLG